MTNSGRKWHPEVEHNLSYLGPFVDQLLEAGRPDLASLIHDESNLTPTKLEDIVRVGLELGIDIALPIAKRQRAVRIILEEEGPSFDGNGVNDILQFVDTHWDVLREERRYRFDEANELRHDSGLSALDSEDDLWDTFGEFDDLFETYFERFLRDYRERMKTFTSDDMDTIILDLPDEFQEVFDVQYRDPLEEEFRTMLGNNWVDLINPLDDLGYTVQSSC